MPRHPREAVITGPPGSPACAGRAGADPRRTGPSDSRHAARPRTSKRRAPTTCRLHQAQLPFARGPSLAGAPPGRRARRGAAKRVTTLEPNLPTARLTPSGAYGPTETAWTPPPTAFKLRPALTRCPRPRPRLHARLGGAAVAPALPSAVERLGASRARAARHSGHARSHRARRRWPLGGQPPTRAASMTVVTVPQVVPVFRPMNPASARDRVFGRSSVRAGASPEGERPARLIRVSASPAISGVLTYRSESPGGPCGPHLSRARLSHLPPRWLGGSDGVAVAIDCCRTTSSPTRRGVPGRHGHQRGSG